MERANTLGAVWKKDAWELFFRKLGDIRAVFYLQIGMLDES
jgi:hypothetical protein